MEREKGLQEKTRRKEKGHLIKHINIPFGIAQNVV